MSAHEDDEGSPDPNEAELHTRLVRRIAEALPLLPAEIRIERHLHLRLGHHHVLVDGATTGQNALRGRFDAGVYAGSRPLLLVEVKAPHVAVTEDDVAQGRSYARLHEPMFPLVVATNGSTTLVRRTYDGAPLPGDVLESTRLEEAVATAAALARSSSDDAIRTLLGGSRETWKTLLSAWTASELEPATGAARDLTCPLVSGFHVPRKVTRKLVKRLDCGERALVLHGPPLSGVTSVLAQVARDLGRVRPTLFVDAVESPDVLRGIATRLTRELGMGVTKDDVRGWLNTGRNHLDIAIVVDGVPDEVNELIELATSGMIQLVIGLGTEAYRTRSRVVGRNRKTRLGRLHAAELGPLDDDEFVAVQEVFERRFEALFYDGARQAMELRWPRALRVVAASLEEPERAPSPMPPETEEGPVARTMLPPIVTIPLLERLSRAFTADPALTADLDALARAVLSESKQRAGDVDWLGATWGRPSVPARRLKEDLGEASYERLVETGYLSIAELARGEICCVVTIEELYAYHVGRAWRDELARATSKTLTSKIDELVALAAVVPLGHLSLAWAVAHLSTTAAAAMAQCIERLLAQPPQVERLGEGAHIQLLVKGRPIRIRFGEGMDEEVVARIHPWLVLSHLCAIPWSDPDFNFALLSVLGRTKQLLYDPPPRALHEIVGLHMHEIPGIGSLPCMNTGLVEPLSQSMLICALNHPGGLVRLAELASRIREPYLGWRVMTVARIVTSAVDPRIAEAGDRAYDIVSAWWDETVGLRRHE